ncbi:uncharacterized protein CIMG_12572 [Coccidioides immitis RS]|uniref:Uncharacterized protein n=1 Tax=Coccidioides immitis (strain RS) TaxID=246410 RepID=A0A0D8JSG3_COCIM|nr:uncharacterized protein CIMG_12572 [Coccidioides immitis RS]KJF59921.1 hypothetical protein CIMG_12572 [Coccidioides immitis RS]
MSAFKAPAVNTQDLINRILQLEQITKKLEEQNCKLKHHNKQLEVQVIAILSTEQQEKKDKVKVNPLELFKNKVNQNNNMLKIIDSYDIFIQILKTTFREVEE